MKHKKEGSFFARSISYLFGMAMLAFGLSLMTKADLGMSPAFSTVFCLSQILSLNITMLIFILFSLFVVTEILIHLLSGKYKQTILDLLQLLISIPFFMLLKLLEQNIPSIPNEFDITTLIGAALHFGVLAAAILFTGIGTAMALNARFIPLPSDGILQTFSDTTGKGIGFFKGCFDVLGVVLALLLGIILKGRIIGIGVGTIISAICVGLVIAAFNRLFTKKDKNNSTPTVKDNSSKESIRIAPERRSTLIKDTTREQRIKIVNDSLGIEGDSYEALCEGIGNTGVIYKPYIDGIKELWEINEESAYSPQPAYQQETETEVKVYPTVMFETYRPEQDTELSTPRSVLIKDTTREQRMQIVNSSLGGDGDSYEATCEGMGNTGNMYQPYIDGIKELWEINEENSNFYIS